RSTNWKSAVFESNWSHSSSDNAKSISDVHSAILRALRATTTSSPRAVRMNPVPMSGTKVTSKSSGQWLTTIVPGSARQKVPCDQRYEPDHHREGVVVEIASLQPARPSRQIAGDGRHPIGPEPVDHRAIAGFPQPVAGHHGRPDKQRIVKFVEIPLVEQEKVQRAELGGEPHGESGIDDVENVGDGDADHSDGQRYVANKRRDSFRDRKRVVLRQYQDRCPPKTGALIADKEIIAKKTKESGADRQHDQRYQHHPWALMRVM